MQKPVLVLLAAVLSLSACSTVSPEARVRERLLNAGLKPRLAGCMAERLVDRLSIAQLRSLGRLGKLSGADVGGMSIDEFLYRLRAIDDPEILSVVTRAGIGCAISG